MRTQRHFLTIVPLSLLLAACRSTPSNQSDVNNIGDYDCSDEALEGYKADLTGIASEIFALRAGSPTIIQAMNLFNPMYSRWEAWDDGMYDEYRRCWNALNGTIQQAAVESGCPVANVYDAFKGIDHEEDPIEKGYI